MHFYYCLPYECQQIAELLVNFLKKNCLLVGFDKKMEIRIKYQGFHEKGTGTHSYLCPQG